MASGQSKSYALFGGTTVTQNDVKQITQYTQMIKSGIPTGQAWQSTMQGCSVAARQHVLACKNDTVALEELTVAEKSNTIASKAGSVALKGLAIAGNMIAMWAIVTVITKVAQGIDELAHSTEKCKERVEELMSSFNSTLTTANNNAKRVEELTDSYDKLSKGVNNLGENVSLTSDEYSEYNSLVNEIADMFPTLISGYTDEGNAILTLKGNVEQLRDAYKEAQQEAYNMLITSGEDSDGNDIIKNWDNLHDTDFFAKAFDFGADDVGGGISTEDAIKQLKEFQNMTAETYREIERITSSGSHKEIQGLTDIQKDIGYGSYLYKALGIDAQSTDEEIADAKKQAQVLVQTYNAEVQSALNDVESLANAYLMTNDDYSKLSDQSKTAASLIVNNLNEDIANGFENKEDVGAYVAEIVSMIKDNPDMNDALVGLFTLDSESLNPTQMKEQVDVFINKIAEWMGEDPVELKVRLGFDNTDDLATKYEHAIKSAQDKFGTDETKFFTDNSINTPEEIDNWLKIAKSANSAAEAEQNYLNAGNANETSLTGNVLSDIQDLSPGLSKLDSIYADILDGGSFDWSSIINNDEFEATFGGLGSSYQNFIDTVTNNPNDISACQPAIDQLSSSYLYQSGVLDKLSDDTAQSAINMLTETGYANANSMAMNALAANKEYAAATGNNLADATYEEIVQLAQEGSTTDQPTEETIDFCINNQLEDIQIVRQSSFSFGVSGGKSGNPTPIAPKTPKKSSTRKYICPCCGNSFRATKEINVMCMDCNEQYIIAE